MATKQTLTAATLYQTGTLSYDQALAYSGSETALNNALKSVPETLPQ